MKPVAEWTEADLHELVTNQVQESLTLDYKRSAALAKTNECKAELSKDVSAFANSAGGRLIYGVIETGDLPSSIDKGCGPSITREWIEQIINSQIQPRVQGLIIKPIPLSGGGNAFVIDIPQAKALAPHQAYDKKYYRRFNFMSVPMDDYEVKDVMRRSTTGHPIIYFRTRVAAQYIKAESRINITVYATNLSPTPTDYAAIQIHVDSRLWPITMVAGSFAYTANLQIWNEIENNRSLINVLSWENHPAKGMPIFREHNSPILEFEIPIPESGHRYYMGYRIASPGFDEEIGGSIMMFGGKFDPPDKLARLFPSTDDEIGILKGF